MSLPAGHFTPATRFVRIEGDKALFDNGQTFTLHDAETALGNLRRQDTTRYPCVLKELPAFEAAVTALKARG